MKIEKSILTKNPCYTSGKKINVKGLMLHSVGCPQPSASVFIQNWNNPSHNASCVHGFIDGNDGTVYQTLPWDYRGWHCGKGNVGSANDTHIGVEMCEPSCIKYTGGSNFTCTDIAAAKAVVKRTYEAAVELFAFLCREFGLNPMADGVIISHKEGCERGIASNHGDPEHLWKQLEMEYTMNSFRQAVRDTINGMPVEEKSETSKFEGETDNKQWYRIRKEWTDTASQKGAFQSLDHAKICADENPGYSVFDESGEVIYPSITKDSQFQVKIHISNLNIRKGPGINFDKTGKYTGIGTFTIVKVKSGKGSDSGWGLLKSYQENEDGWISIDYTERV